MTMREDGGGLECSGCSCGGGGEGGGGGGRGMIPYHSTFSLFSLHPELLLYCLKICLDPLYASVAEDL